ncbi:unnamed protein product [Closterium sp. NIES-54]
MTGNAQNNKVMRMLAGDPAEGPESRTMSPLFDGDQHVRYVLRHDTVNWEACNAAHVTKVARCARRAQDVDEGTVIRLLRARLVEYQERVSSRQGGEVTSEMEGGTGPRGVTGGATGTTGTAGGWGG